VSASLDVERFHAGASELAMKPFFFVAIPAALLVSVTALAQDRGHPPGPPPEALEACEGLSTGAACTVETPHGRLSGTCGAPPGMPLACMPEGGPHGHRGPPPGAIDACSGIDVGDACVIDTPDGTLEGTCADGPHGVACRPPHPPGDRGPTGA
jgi:hypothetical protein